MDAVLRELNGQVDLATQRLLDDARTLNESDLRAPSLLPGWTRAYVLAHVARGADAMRDLLAVARSGQDHSVSTSAQAWQAATEQGATMRSADLMADLADSAMALRAVARQLPDEAWQVLVRVPDVAPFPAAEVLTRRLVEVELHHCDLASGYGPADWPPAFADMELAEPMRSQRQDRRTRSQPAPDTAPRSTARSPVPWKPGQRLPGSWIGRGGGALPPCPARARLLLGSHFPLPGLCRPA
jgi:maleylpyruvate isomerase